MVYFFNSPRFHTSFKVLPRPVLFFIAFFKLGQFLSACPAMASRQVTIFPLATAPTQLATYVAIAAVLPGTSGNAHI